MSIMWRRSRRCIRRWWRGGGGSRWGRGGREGSLPPYRRGTVGTGAGQSRLNWNAPKLSHEKHKRHEITAVIDVVWVFFVCFVAHFCRMQSPWDGGFFKEMQLFSG